MGLLQPLDAILIMTGMAALIWIARGMRIIIGLALVVGVVLVLTQVDVGTVLATRMQQRTPPPCAGAAKTVFVVPASHFPINAAHIRDAQTKRLDWMRLCRNGARETEIDAHPGADLPEDPGAAGGPEL